MVDILLLDTSAHFIAIVRQEGQLIRDGDKAIAEGIVVPLEFDHENVGFFVLPCAHGHLHIYTRDGREVKDVHAYLDGRE